jgi:hypothetical protein
MVQMLQAYDKMPRYDSLSPYDLASKGQMLLANAYKDYFTKAHEYMNDPKYDKVASEYKMKQLDKATTKVLGFVPDVEGKAWEVIMELTNIDLNDLPKYKTKDEKESGVAQWFREVRENY